jgi:hypothetical protein
MYYLTPEGFQRKLDLSCQFLQVKAREFELLQKEIEILKQEVLNSPSAAPAFSGVPPVPFNE